MMEEERKEGETRDGVMIMMLEVEGERKVPTIPLCHHTLPHPCWVFWDWFGLLISRVILNSHS